MYKILIAAFFIFLHPNQLQSQVLPKEGSRLNYRIIGFSFPKNKSGNKYKIEIATGNYTSEDSFKNNIIKSFPCDNNRVVSEVPFFGKQYTWRAISTSTHATIKSKLHHFSTTTNSSVDTTMMRLKIIKPAETYKDAYLLMDGTKALYDMKGNPLWFLPVVDTVPADKIWGFGDMNYTQQGTITYLTTPKGGQVYEADLNGTVLWRGPNNGKVNGDSIEYYNHEFVRMPNGHYMVLGGEYILSKLPGSVNSNYLKNNPDKEQKIIDSNHVFYQRLRFGTVIEYDAHSNVVWSWKSAKYFLGSDLFNHTTPMGTFDINNVHENSFYFDEKNQVIYIGFRDISRILKVKYPEGNILKVYGNTYEAGIHGYDNSQFYHQHSCRISQDGYLYMYNNNNRDKKTLPTLVMFRMPVSDKDTLQKIWEYQCTAEYFDTTLRDLDFSALGSIVELPDRSFLACMTASNYTRVFIVNRDKKVLWNAMPQRYSKVQHKWYPVIQYRADIIINRKDLERMVWKAEQDKTVN